VEQKDGEAKVALTKEDEEEEGQEPIDPRIAWCANAPLMYDLFIGITLEWPALAIAWVPDEPDIDNCRLAMGMHTDGSAKNELVVFELTCSAEDSLEQDPWHSWSVENLGDIEAFGCAASEGYEAPMQLVSRMEHPTEVNRVAPCPFRPQLLATKAATGAVLLFDYKTEKQVGTLTPSGNVADGFALQWSACKRNYLASGGNDGRLCIWDVEVASGAIGGAPLYDLKQAHTSSLCGVTFSRSEPELLSSVGDDGYLRLWDLRTGLSPSQAMSISSDEVLCIDWSHHQEKYVAAAGKDRVVSVWDCRSLKAPVQQLKGHEGDVVAVWWAHFQEGLLASCSTDCSVKLWDMSAEARAEDVLEGASPELLMSHAGHQEGVSDFGWSDVDNYLMCSVSEDNSLQIWQPSAELYLPADEEGEDTEPAAKRARADE